MRVIDLGANVAYDDGLAAMREAMARVDDEGPEGGPALVLIEHTPTITITRRGGTGAFVSPRELIEADGIAVIEADRGGDVTYHGPGQLTGYPILRLGDTSLGCDVVGFVRAMEAGVIDACRALGVTSAHPWIMATHGDATHQHAHVLYSRRPIDGSATLNAVSSSVSRNEKSARAPSPSHFLFVAAASGS